MIHYVFLCFFGKGRTKVVGVFATLRCLHNSNQLYAATSITAQLYATMCASASASASKNTPPLRQPRRWVAPQKGVERCKSIQIHKISNDSIRMPATKPLAADSCARGDGRRSYSSSEVALLVSTVGVATCCDSVWSLRRGNANGGT